MTLAIIATLAAVMVSNLSGTKSKDSVDRATQQIYDELVYIRSRAISTNANHRINFLTDDTWKVEQFDGSSWVDSSSVKNFPSNTNLTSTTFANAGSNLEATPRGLFELNGADGDPFVTFEGLGYSRTKSINVDVGGAISIELD